VSASDVSSSHGPYQWRVVWGSILRPGFMQEIVEAYDVDEALTIASERRPELFRPHVAFLVGGQLPLTKDQ
jgi:hypothetical protein